MEQESEDLRRVVESIERHGVLLESDRELPSVAGLIAGEPLRGSWWGHPRGEAIYRATRELPTHRDVIVTKLISGKVTYVHRKLWPAVLAVGAAGEPWQLEGLSFSARSFLDVVKKYGEFRTDDVPWMGGSKAVSPGDAARELERLILVHSKEIHARSSAHAKRLETWERWAERSGFQGEKMTPAQAKEMLEGVLTDLNKQFDGKGRLPWDVP